MVGLALLLGGCSWVNSSGRLGSDLPETIKALSNDPATVHLKVTAPTFGTLELDRSGVCPPPPSVKP